MESVPRAIKLPGTESLVLILTMLSVNEKLVSASIGNEIFYLLKII